MAQESTQFETILFEEDGPIARITLNRPQHGNQFNLTMLLELKQVLESTRRETRTRVIILTGAGDKFFCIGGDKEGLDHTKAYPGVLPIVDVYEMIDRHPKPIIAAVNGFAVGGGNVLQVVCDLTIAKESAIFRQVGPMMGSFDAGFGTWYLEDLVGRKRAKEIWFLNEKLTAARALEMGLINRVVPDGVLMVEATKMAGAIAERGSQAIAALKASFSARSGGAGAFARVAHDMLLAYYLDSEEADELSKSFAEHRKPQPSRFGQ
jgi:naphthoate synthase